MIEVIREVGVVAIGRNEGERLRACLTSAREAVTALVYVDSGSTDGSVACARELGASIVELDSDVPFTAARARNAGLAQLVNDFPAVGYVQFVDGDCEFESGWIEAAASSLDEGDWTVVCGRRRERFPERSVYNLLCDMEWDTPPGPVAACGGDALIRVAALQAVGGYSDDLIAGEEPELCVRLAEQGGLVLRLDAPMTIHDARMFRFSQWWQRAKRAGHAVAEAADRHPGFADGYAEREVRSAWVWALGIPLIMLVLAWPTNGASLLMLGLYPVQALRIGLRLPRPNFSVRDNLWYGASCVASKFPHWQGALRFAFGRFVGRRSRLIEYKGTS